MPYEILVPEYTIQRDIRELTNKHGEVTGRQLGLGKVYYQGEVVADSAVGQVYKDALDDEDHDSHEYVSERLREVSGADLRENTQQRLGVPFAGYDGMDEDAIVTAMLHLPSALIQSIKKYEAEHGEGRDRIVQYNIAYQTDPKARAEGRTDGAGAQDEDSEGRANAASSKATADRVTREVTEEGEITHGEGITGTGEGKIVVKKTDSDSDSKKVVRNRRGRRDRPAGEE